MSACIDSVQPVGRYLITIVTAIVALLGGSAESDERSVARDWVELRVDQPPDVRVVKNHGLVEFHLSRRPDNGVLEFPRLNNVVLRAALRLLSQDDADAEGRETPVELKFTQDAQIWRIELPETCAFPACVELHVSGEPLYRSTPHVAKASADGAIALSARHAETYGKKLQFEPLTHKNTVGYWIHPEDWVEWRFLVSQPGKYRVRILQGCGAGQGGSRVSVMTQPLDTIAESSSGLQRLDFDVLETGHFQRFRWREIGSLDLSSGELLLQLRVVRLAQSAVMDVRQIRLEPLNQQTRKGDAASAADLPRPPRPMSDVEPDLVVPPTLNLAPAAGRRVRQTVDGYDVNAVHHAIYLPTDWRKDKQFPVLVELTGNGPYVNELGDRCTGTVDDARLGFGIGGGDGMIWLTLPYLDHQGTRNVDRWWGDPPLYNGAATIAYWRQAIEQVCTAYGGDRRRIVLIGFSRGALACNYLGLADDQIASTWAAFVCYSHYDGVSRKWPYPDRDRTAAIDRLRRLRGRPQFICSESIRGETSLEATQQYLNQAQPDGAFTFRTTGFLNHDDRWVLRPSDCRRELREWLKVTLQR